MRFNGLLLNNWLPLVHISCNSKVVSDSLIGFSSKFASLRTTMPISRSSTSLKRCIYMNNIVVLDHCGLFIYLNNKYLGFFHDVNILHESNLYKNQHKLFRYTNECFEYLLGDPSYLGEDMFAMQWFVRCKLALGHILNVMQTCNKMHVGYKIWVEWGIWKWKRLMKCFDSTLKSAIICYKLKVIF